MDIVLKFGGTSLGTPDALRRSATVVADALRSGHRPVVVVSALANERGRATEKLVRRDECEREWVIDEYRVLTEAIGVTSPVALFEELAATPFCYEQECLSFGERLMAAVFASYLQMIGVDAKPVDAREFVIATLAGTPVVDETRTKIVSYFQGFQSVPVVTGFVARTPDGKTATLGHGGSDLTAVLLAVGLGIRTELWTDVHGIMTADPRIVPDARVIDVMTYREAFQAVHAGAKGIPPEAIQIAERFGITISIKSLRDPEASGTRIGALSFAPSRAPKLVAHNGYLALMTVSSASFPGATGTLARIASTLADRNVNIGMLAQSLSEQSITFVVHERDAFVAHRALVALFDGSPVDVEGPILCSVVTMVGEAMKGGVGISGRLDGALGRAGVNILAAAQACEDAISIACARENGPTALRAAHEEFFGHDGAPAIFLLGVGNIGKALLEQMCRVGLPRGAHLCGIANSKKMAIVPQGIALERALELLGDSAEAFQLDQLLARARRVPAGQHIVVDCTASAEVARRYLEFLNQRFDVVAANKLANVAPLDEYSALVNALRRSGRRFLDSANVGGKLGILPVIRRCGPVITRIEAMLSGTLGWLLSHYNSTKPFAELVEEARKLGLTEPDPRLDLSGEDVARKLLILLRTLGVRAEFAQVRPCVEDLRGRDEAYFRELLDRARTSGKVLRYVANLAPHGEVGASLMSVGPESPFFSAHDAENVVVVHTRSGAPIVLRGPGAGPHETAEAVFLDVIEVLSQ